MNRAVNCIRSLHLIELQLDVVRLNWLWYWHHCHFWIWVIRVTEIVWQNLNICKQLTSNGSLPCSNYIIKQHNLVLSPLHFGRLGLEGGKILNMISVSKMAAYISHIVLNHKSVDTSQTDSWILHHSASDPVSDWSPSSLWAYKFLKCTQRNQGTRRQEVWGGFLGK